MFDRYLSVLCLEWRSFVVSEMTPSSGLSFSLRCKLSDNKHFPDVHGERVDGGGGERES